MSNDEYIIDETSDEDKTESLKRFLAKQALYLSVEIVATIGVYTVLNTVMPLPKQDLKFVKRVFWSIGAWSISGAVSYAITRIAMDDLMETYEALAAFDSKPFPKQKSNDDAIEQNHSEFDVE